MQNPERIVPSQDDTTEVDESKVARQHAGQQGPSGGGAGQESLSQIGNGGYGQSGQLGFDEQTGAPVDQGSNWLAQGGVDPEELGANGGSVPSFVGYESREDNGQTGPTQENGGIGYGDEEGLGRTGLSEAGDIGSQEDRSAPETYPERDAVTDVQDVPEDQILTDETVPDRQRGGLEPARNSETTSKSDEGLLQRKDEQTGEEIELPRD